ncbi:hypothetical protein EYF80_022567 [Liparis tanakae]|uniref:Uncharacterized protein n=1 Tax=Liparis tanakae TaxID=230148 RepID=A0A4Z2HMY4_9TELE|nr:hypothetical protein EYF80_022567 [Liparis tanakae]
MPYRNMFSGVHVTSVKLSKMPETMNALILQLRSNKWDLCCPVVSFPASPLAFISRGFGEALSADTFKSDSFNLKSRRRHVCGCLSKMFESRKMNTCGDRDDNVC